MSNMQFSLMTHEGERFITVLVPGERDLLSARSDHPNFERIVQGALANDPSIVDLFDNAKTAARFFAPYGERVSVSNGQVFVDGDPIDNALTHQIVRFIEEDVSDWLPLVNFYEKVMTNPNEHSREQLYDFVRTHEITISDDGDLVLYKSVFKTDDGYKSVTSGPAIVNGREHTEGQVPQDIGDVIEMPRSQVIHDPGAGCSFGLHVGAYRYASGFSGDTILEVRVNPRDVVSVPSDCNFDKLRVCRYYVAGIVEKEHDTAVVSDEVGSDWDWVDDFEEDVEESDDCGCGYDCEGDCW